MLLPMSPRYRCPWSSIAMSSQSRLGIASRNWRTIRPSLRTAKSRGAFPESLWTQKIPGKRRLLTIPDASGIACASNRPRGSSGGSPGGGPENDQACEQNRHGLVGLPWLCASRALGLIVTNPRNPWPRSADDPPHGSLTAGAALRFAGRYVKLGWSSLGSQASKPPLAAPFEE